MRSIFLSVALVGVLGLSVSLSVRAAEPVVLNVVVSQTSDVPAFLHEIEVLRGLYKKQGLAVTIEAYQGSYAGDHADKGRVNVQTWVPNLAALAKMNEMNRTQPDLVAEMKKIDGMRKIVLNAIYNKVTQ